MTREAKMFWNGERLWQVIAPSLQGRRGSYRIVNIATERP